MNNRKSIIGHILAIFTILVWGATFIVTKKLLVYFSPLEILVFRFLLAYFVLFLFKPKPFKFTNWKHEGLFFIASLASVSIYQYLENAALQYSSACNVSIIIACAAFFTAIFSKIILKNENISKLFYIGFIISIIGVVLVSFNGNVEFNIFPLGDFMALVAAILWGVYGVVIKIVLQNDYDPVYVTRRVMMYGVIALIPVCFITNADLSLGRFADLENLFGILFLGVLASAISFYTWNVATMYLGAVKTSLYIYFNPVVTIVLSALILNERLSLMGIIGTVLIMLGLYVSTFKINNKNLITSEK